MILQDLVDFVVVMKIEWRRRWRDIANADSSIVEEHFPLCTFTTARG